MAKSGPNKAKAIVDAAAAGGWAVPAMCLYNLEGIIASVAAAEAKSSPVILQLFPWAVEYANGLLVHAAAEAAAKAKVPVAVHMDHCQSPEMVKRAADLGGFDGIMVDMSHYEKEENLAKTKELTEYCHARGIITEAEPGRINGGEDGVSDTADLEGILTTVEQADEFIATGIDWLAPAFGNVHGKYGPRGPQLEYDRLGKIRESTKGRVELVLHGAGAEYFDEKLLQECIGHGIAKCNINDIVNGPFMEHLAEKAKEGRLTALIEESTAVIQRHTEKCRIILFQRSVYPHGNFAMASQTSRASRTQVVDVEYRDARTGNRVYERRVQEVPWEEISNVRNRELALVRRRDSSPEPETRRYEERSPPRRREEESTSQQDQRSPPRRREEEYTSQRGQRSRIGNDDEVVPYRREDRYDRRAPRRDDGGARDQDDNNDKNSDGQSARSHQRRPRQREGGRARSEDRSQTGRNRRGGGEKEKKNEQQDDNGKLWYSMKNRREGNLLERNFDSSYDGLIAAAAGAALGAITARNLDKDQFEDASVEGKRTKILKMVGGAVAGAAVLNVGENWYRVYTEEKEERKEVKEKEGTRRERENGFKSNGEMLGEGFESLQYV
ncbi:hypothetical protein LTR35_013901 [Friedmanniomyces endolithicus]|uniref:Fructose-bisphosphate aldolase n=1 Tax=Friedmanniomyces endolithicus TaxID=329885 RepID=A0AAN6J3G5_9PEZI|nr:hypothetical protein LTR35_013901 [Friedmanniomyces endolithicus]KAK0313309.1 hypothetical protein LTR82_013543 [Friedmanniomyces endolithicus]